MEKNWINGVMEWRENGLIDYLVSERKLAKTVIFPQVRLSHRDACGKMTKICIFIQALIININRTQSFIAYEDLDENFITFGFTNFSKSL